MAVRVEVQTFNVVLLTALRAHLMIERVRDNEATGIEAAATLEAAATGAAGRVVQLLDGTAAPDAEEFAEKMGWPSAEALVEFLFGGCLPEGEHEH